MSPRWPASRLEKRARREHYPAPYAILELWEKYDGDPFLPPPQDPASIAYLVQHPTAKNLIRVFGLQERMKSLGKDSSFQAQRVHVIGAGTMGGDIAAICALRGLTVTLQDTTPERLAPAMKRAAELFGKRLRDKLRVRDALDRLMPDVNGDGVRHADVIIEAIFENLQVKQDLFAAVEARAKPGAILATNTSSLKLADIAQRMKDRSRLVGLHFFNPVPQLQLVEVVASAATDPEGALKGAAFVRQIDKLPLPVKDSPGFLVNRVLGPYMANAFRMLDEGVKAETIDKAAEQFGMPMGPIALADTVGLDICAAAGKSLAGADATAAAATCGAPEHRQARQENRRRFLPLGEGQAGQRQGRPGRRRSRQAGDGPLPRRSEEGGRRRHRRRCRSRGRRAHLRHRVRAVHRRAAELREDSRLGSCAASHGRRGVRGQRAPIRVPRRWHSLAVQAVARGVTDLQTRSRA